MTIHTIGELSLSLSTVIYMVWLLPQLWHNHRRSSTQGFSFSTHILLCISNLCDLLYGFGFHMQWQYRMVTISVLFSLFVQHLQYRPAFNKSIHLSRLYSATTSGLCALLVIIIFLIKIHPLNNQWFLWAGSLSVMIGFVIWLPQIRINYRYKNTKGLSVLFLLFTFFLCVLDLISALCLQWNWPSIIGPLVGLGLKSTLLLQYYIYSDLRLKNKYPPSLLGHAAL